MVASSFIEGEGGSISLYYIEGDHRKQVHSMRQNLENSILGDSLCKLQYVFICCIRICRHFHQCVKCILTCLLAHQSLYDHRSFLGA